MTIFQNMHIHKYSKRKKLLNANLKRRIKHGALIDHSQRKQGKDSFFTLSFDSFFVHWLSLLRFLTHSKYSSFHSLPPKTMVFFLKICRQAFPPSVPLVLGTSPISKRVLLENRSEAFS